MAAIVVYSLSQRRIPHHQTTHQIGIDSCTPLDPAPNIYLRLSLILATIFQPIEFFPLCKKLQIRVAAYFADAVGSVK